MKDNRSRRGRRMAGHLIIGAMVGCLGASAWSREPAPCPDLRALGPGPHRIDFAPISAVVSLPGPCFDVRCGLIVDIHGASMSGDDQDRATNMRGLGAGAVARGAPTPYVVIQPESRRPSHVWRENDEDDVAALAACAVSNMDIAPGRRHVDGYSQGGYMVAGLFCKPAQPFDDFAAMSGGAEIFQTCLDPARATRLLYMHGRLDRLVPFGLARKLIGRIEKMATGRSELSADRTVYRVGEAVVDIVLHDSRNTLIKGHCMPGAQGLPGCDGPFHSGELVIDYFIRGERRRQNLSAGVHP